MSGALAVAAAGMTGAVHPEVMTVSTKQDRVARAEERRLKPREQHRVAAWVVDQTIRRVAFRS